MTHIETREFLDILHGQLEKRDPNERVSILARKMVEIGLQPLPGHGVGELQ